MIFIDRIRRDKQGPVWREGKAAPRGSDCET